MFIIGMSFRKYPHRSQPRIPSAPSATSTCPASIEAENLSTRRCRSWAVRTSESSVVASRRAGAYGAPRVSRGEGGRPERARTAADPRSPPPGGAPPSDRPQAGGRAVPRGRGTVRAWDLRTEQLWRGLPVVVLPGYARRERRTRWEERARDGPTTAQTTAQTNPSSTSSHPLSVMTCLCPEPSTTRLQLATTSRSSWIDMRKPPSIPG